MTPPAIDSAELLEHADWVRDLARQLVRDAHAAEDAAQDALVTALSRPPRTRTNLRGWLASVLRNHVRSRMRRDRRRLLRERAQAREEHACSPEELVDRLSQHRAVVDDVQELPEPVRQAILLRFFERRSLREIAAQTGVPLPTVNTRIRRGLSLLRERLDRRYGDRRAWVAAMLPLLGQRPAAQSVAGSWWAASLVAAVLAVTAVSGGLWWSDETAPSSEGAIATKIVADPAAAARATSTPPRRVAIEHRATLPTTTTRRQPVTGQVIDAEGVARADVEVSFFAARSEDRHPQLRARQNSVRPLPSRPAQEALATAVTNATGDFTMAAPRIDGRLRVTSSGWATVLAGVSWNDLADNRLIVAAPVRSLSGFVRDARGNAIEHARLLWKLPANFRARFDRALDRSVLELHETVTDAAGRFSLPVPELAGATLVVGCADYEERRIQLDGVENLADIVLVALADSVTSSFILRFVDEAGTPAVDTKVVVDGHHVHEVDTRGQLELAAAEVAPDAEMVALRPGYQSVRLTLADVPVDEPWTVPIAEPAFAIHGLVVDRAGKPIAGAYAWLRDPTVFANSPTEVAVVESQIAGARTSWNVVVTDRAGRFRIVGLEQRTYDVRVALPGHCLFGEARSVQAGDRNAVVRYPTEEVVAEVRGIAVDRTGAPVPGILVGGSRTALRLELQNGSHAAWFANGPQARTAADGTFVLPDVPRGIDLAVSGKGIYLTRFPAATWEGQESVRLAVSHRCHLQITTATPGPERAFRVLDAEGDPVQIRMLLGIASQPLERWPLDQPQSPVLVIPDHAATVVVYDAEEEVVRAPITPTPFEITRVQF